MTRRAQVLGAGGHARVVIATLQDSGVDVVAVWDDDAARHGSLLDGVEIRGAIADAAPDLDTIVAIGANRARAAVGSRSLRWGTAVHPTAYVHRSARLGPGTVVFAGAIVQPGAVLGAHVIVNTGASVDHDCQVGDYVHLAPGVRLCGNVSVGEGALIGVGAVARPGAEVGPWATVGAGAVVIERVPPETVVYGVPARPRHSP